MSGAIYVNVYNTAVGVVRHVCDETYSIMNMKRFHRGVFGARAAQRFADRPDGGCRRSAAGVKFVFAHLVFTHDDCLIVRLDKRAAALYWLLEGRGTASTFLVVGCVFGLLRRGVSYHLNQRFVSNFNDIGPLSSLPCSANAMCGFSEAACCVVQSAPTVFHYV